MHDKKKNNTDTMTDQMTIEKLKALAQKQLDQKEKSHQRYLKNADRYKHRHQKYYEEHKKEIIEQKMAKHYENHEANKARMRAYHRRKKLEKEEELKAKVISTQTH